MAFGQEERAVAQPHDLGLAQIGRHPQCSSAFPRFAPQPHFTKSLPQIQRNSNCNHGR